MDPRLRGDDGQGARVSNETLLSRSQKMFVTPAEAEAHPMRSQELEDYLAVTQRRRGQKGQDISLIRSLRHCVTASLREYFLSRLKFGWIPAYAGTTGSKQTFVTPAKAGGIRSKAHAEASLTRR
jgi:hypothetical protein